MARFLTRQFAPAFVAGVYFAASPYFAGHLLGHFNLVSAWCLPLFALTLLRALERPQIIRASLAGAALAMTAYADYYYVVYLVAFMLVVATWRWLDARIATNKRSRVAAIDIALLALLVAIVALAVWVAMSGGGVIALGSWTISMRSGFNLRIAAWVLAVVLVLRWFRPRLRIAAVDTVYVWRDARVVGVVVAVAAVLAAPLWIPAVQLIVAGDYTSPARLWRSSTAGIDLVSLIAGNPFHPLWRSTAEVFYDRLGMSTIESTAWLGIAPVVFLIWRRHALAAIPRARVWVAVAVVFFIWACGPFLTVAGVNTGLMLPETLLHYVPVVSNARIPGRTMVMVYLAIGLLLAFALASARRRPIAAPVLTALVLIDFLPAPTHLYRLDVPRIYREVAALPPGAVWEFPFGIGDGFGERGALDNATMYYQTTHGRPLVGGFVARMPRRLLAAHEDTPALRAVLAMSEGRALSSDERARAVVDVLSFMRTHGIRAIVLNLATASPDLQSFADALALRVVAEGDGRRLYVLE